jgi:capsular polysaccharide biosynthesis protein
LKEIIKEKKGIHRIPPENFNAKDLIHFDSDLDGGIGEIHLLKVLNALIIQRYLFKNLVILEDYVHTHGVTFSTRMKAALKPLFFWKRDGEFAKAIWPLDTWSKGYFHWLTDFLPRCISAEGYWDDYPVLVPSYYLELDYIRETCEIFPFKTLPFSISGSYRVNALIVPTRLTSCAFDTDQIKKVRSYFRDFDEFEFSQNRKIYISRKKSLRRKVLNEEELEQSLEVLGFQIVCMEDLNFKDQRHLLSETKILLSNHGAGLTNMIFLPNEAKVIELKADVPTINNCFFNLARALDHEYYYTMNWSESTDIQKADIRVDINLLMNLLNRL